MQGEVPPLFSTEERFPPLVAVFNPATLDLEAEVGGFLAGDILELELPHLCELRPHEDPLVEAWLARWIDGEGLSGSSLTLESRCLPQLLALALERPEICPSLCAQLTAFEQAIQVWLKAWPPAEPPRKGFGWTGPTPEALELELHGVLALQRGEAYAWSLLEEGREPELRDPAIALHGDGGDTFQQVAMGWALKLDIIYGLNLMQQPDRMVAAAGPTAGQGLSLFRWSTEQVEQLLACQFWRPAEARLVDLVQRWLQESGADEESEARVTQALLEELLDDGTAAAGEVAGPLPPAVESLPASGNAEGSGLDAVSVERQERIRVRAGSFQLAPRHDSCTTAAFNDPEALQRQEVEGAVMRWRNVAREEQILGASRQLLASQVSMSPIVGGIFRLDLRVISGTEKEAAHMLEVGVAVECKGGGTQVSAVCFDAGGVRAPAGQDCEDGGGNSAYFNLHDVGEIVNEGVRVIVEVDIGCGAVRLRNIPSVTDDDQREASLVKWLQARAQVAAKNLRPHGELGCRLFRYEAEHLQDLHDRGRLDREFAASVRSDEGLKAVLSAADDAVATESYCFYVVVPAGLEVEIF